MKAKKYKIGYNWDDELEEYMDYIKLDINDLSEFFYQIRGFPSILRLGTLTGEGQSGGRFITDIAKKLEREIISNIGIDKYTKVMDKLMEND